MGVELARLRRCPLFAELSDDVLASVADFCQRREFGTGETVFLYGQPATAFYLVEYGRIKVYRSTAAGREQILHLVEPGQSVAELAVLAMERYPASAGALEETSTVVVPRQEFRLLVENNGEAAQAMLAGQARWLRHLVDLTSTLMLEDVQARLARYLVSFANSHRLEWKDGALLELGIKKNVIATQIGTKPETLSRTLGKLERRNLLHREGRAIIVMDAEKLHNLAYPDS